MSSLWSRSVNLCSIPNNCPSEFLFLETTIRLTLSPWCGSYTFSQSNVSSRAIVGKVTMSLCDAQWSSSINSVFVIDFISDKYISIWIIEISLSDFRASGIRLVAYAWLHTFNKFLLSPLNLSFYLNQLRLRNLRCFGWQLYLY